MTMSPDRLPIALAALTLCAVGACRSTTLDARVPGDLPVPSDGGVSAEAHARPVRLASSLAQLERLARGARIPLIDAQLFVPGSFALPSDGVVPLSVHFQGGTAIAEENFVRSGQEGVLLASTLAGLSSVFSKAYADTANFHALLAAAEASLSTRETRVRFEPIVVTFFSAGYGAVRELLKDPILFERIDALVSADSIYASVVADGVRAPDAEQMVDFMRFAQAAARGEKTFVLVHGETPTPYASTEECANLALASVAAVRSPAGRFTERGVPLHAEAHVGQFHLYSCAEGRASEEDAKRIHMDCLYMVPELVRTHVLARDGALGRSSPAVTPK